MVDGVDEGKLDRHCILDLSAPLHTYRPLRTSSIAMSQDPYHAVQREIQTSLQAASTLRASYLRIRSTARDESEELVWARNEVRVGIRVLELTIHRVPC